MIFVLRDADTALFKINVGLDEKKKLRQAGIDTTYLVNNSWIVRSQAQKVLQALGINLDRIPIDHVVRETIPLLDPPVIAYRSIGQ